MSLTAIGFLLSYLECNSVLSFVICRMVLAELIDAVYPGKSQLARCQLEGQE